MLDDPPIDHDRHVVTRASCETDLVGDHQHCDAASAQLGHRVEDLTDERGVERARRLVEQNYLRVHGEGPGDADALLLAAGELAGVEVGPVLDSYCPKVLHGDGPGLALAHALDVHRPRHHVLDGSHVREQVEMLEHHLDARPTPRDLAASEFEEATALPAVSHHLAVHLDGP